MLFRHNVNTTDSAPDIEAPPDYFHQTLFIRLKQAIGSAL